MSGAIFAGARTSRTCAVRRWRRRGMKFAGRLVVMAAALFLGGDPAPGEACWTQAVAAGRAPPLSSRSCPPMRRRFALQPRFTACRGQRFFNPAPRIRLPHWCCSTTSCTGLRTAMSRRSFLCRATRAIQQPRLLPGARPRFGEAGYAGRGANLRARCAAHEVRASRADPSPSFPNGFRASQSRGSRKTIMRWQVRMNCRLMLRRRMGPHARDRLASRMCAMPLAPRLRG